MTALPMAKKRTNRKNEQPTAPSKDTAAESSSASSSAASSKGRSSASSSSSKKAGSRAKASTPRKSAAARARSTPRGRTGTDVESAEIPAAAERDETVDEPVADKPAPTKRAARGRAASKSSETLSTSPSTTASKSKSKPKPSTSDSASKKPASPKPAASEPAVETIAPTAPTAADDAIGGLREWLSAELARIATAIVSPDEIARIVDARASALIEQVQQTPAHSRDIEGLFPLLSKLELDLDSALTRMPVDVSTQVATSMEQRLAELRQVPAALRSSAQAAELERVHERVAQIEDAMIDATSDLAAVRDQLQALVDGIATLSERLGRTGGDLLHRLRDQRAALRDLRHTIATTGLDATDRGDVAAPIAMSVPSSSDDVLAIVDNLGRGDEDNDAIEPLPAEPIRIGRPHRQVVESVEVEVEADDDSTPETAALPEDHTLDEDLDATDIGTASSLLTSAADYAQRAVTGRHRTVFNAARGLRHLASIPLRDLYRDASEMLTDLEAEEYLTIVKDLLLLECAVAADPDDVDTIDPELTLHVGGANVHAIRLVRDRL